MRSLDVAREVCERYHPGLISQLEGLTLLEREAPGSGVVDMFRKSRGAALLVPEKFGGSGADPIDAVRVMRAVASYSPSLGAAGTMHHFTAAMLFGLAETAGRLTDAQLGLLGRVAPDGLLMASGWAEGSPDQNILSPNVSAERREDGSWLLRGGKRPCSLAHSMDALTASVAVPGPNGDELGVALVPADSDGMSVHPFWASWALAGAESDQVVLDDVVVPDDLVIRTQPDDPSRLDDLQTAGFAWFVLLISSVYVGAASSLVEKVVERSRGTAVQRAEALVALESSMDLLEGVARRIREEGARDDAVVASALVARYATQEALGRCVNLATELLGGTAFMGGSDVAYLCAATKGLYFHPPSRSAASEPLADFFAGEPLRLG